MAWPRRGENSVSCLHIMFKTTMFVTSSVRKDQNVQPFLTQPIITRFRAGCPKLPREVVQLYHGWCGLLVFPRTPPHKPRPSNFSDSDPRFLPACSRAKFVFRSESGKSGRDISTRRPRVATRVLNTECTCTDTGLILYIISVILEQSAGLGCPTQ